jgi:two-component system, LytTR family, response regulator
MLKTIIIDDEPAAREKLELLLKKYCASQIELVAICKSAEEGMKSIASHAPDLVFLDVEMPAMTGFDMLKRLPKIDFEIIFTTAHDHYAIKAIKFSALDYLLKPIDLEQLQEAVNNAVSKRGEKTNIPQYESFVENITGTNKKLENLSIPTSNGMVFVKVNDIIRCESASNYTVFYITNKDQIVATRTLKEFEELLEESEFIRIHHSHLINKIHLKQYIKGAGGQVIMSDGKTLDVSRRKKDEVMEKLKSL